MCYSQCCAGRYRPHPVLSALFSTIKPLLYFVSWLPCACVCIYVCVLGRQYQAGSNQLSSEPLHDLARWRACLLPMTRMISLLRGERHTHTWTGYSAVSLRCHVEGVTLTCITQTVTVHTQTCGFTRGCVQMNTNTHIHTHTNICKVPSLQTFIA